MMEFTLTRAVMFACGIIVLAILLSPVSNIYESRCGSIIVEQCDIVAGMMDSFMESDLDTMEIQGSEIIPEGYTLYIDHYVIIMEREDVRYTSAPSSMITSDVRFTPSDTILLVKTEDTIEMRLI